MAKMMEVSTGKLTRLLLNMVLLFKKTEENISMMRRVAEKFFKYSIRNCREEIYNIWNKNLLEWINIRLDTAEQKIGELEEIAIIIQNEAQRKMIGKTKQKKKTLATSEKISSGLTYMQLKHQKKRWWKNKT